MVGDSDAETSMGWRAWPWASLSPGLVRLAVLIGLAQATDREILDLHGKRPLVV